MWFYAAGGRRLIGAQVEQHEVDHMSRAVLPGVPVNAALSFFYVVGDAVFSNAKGPLRAPSASSS